ncbi:MAG: PAS domain S-box protein [Roseofilum sp. SID3]|nr:PAS domain S-box protein [Roseofilum sp. SID3]MBP0040176.1 PAS domain S-box protein [Roseofilum sp. SID1]
MCDRGYKPKGMLTQNGKVDPEGFDFASILKASQALSEIVQFDKLLRQITQIIWQNSGGDRCALMLPDENEMWQVEAIATAENIDLCRVPLKGYMNLPVKLIEYVKNTREILAIDKSKTDLPVSDPYLDRQDPQSLLCLPLLHQGQLMGIVYLSHQATSGIFTGDRLLVLNFLCTQAALLLENRKLSQTLEQQVQERTEALWESQQELSDYIENATISLHWVDKNGMIVWANQTELDFLGYSREEYIGQPIANFHADPEVIADILTRLSNNETLVNYEARLRCKDGSLRYVAINSNVLYRDSQFIHTRCFTVDITQRKSIERELQASQQRYATLADILPAGIFLTDPQGHSRYNNPSCCQMLGLTPAEALGEGWSQTLHPDDRDRVFQGWYHAAQNQQMPYHTDCRFLHRDGKVVWLSVQAVEEFDLEGHLTGYIGTLIDVTKRKAAEAALHKLVEGTAATTGEDFFPALVRHISKALDVPIALITQFVGEELHSIAFMVDGELQPNFTYNLPETPCIELVTEYSYHCPWGITDRFPNNPHRERGVESYLGIALRDRQGQVLGSLCIFDRQPLQEPERAKQILEIFASRTAAEMQRQRVETSLHSLIAGTAVTKGIDFFPLLVRHLTEALGVSHALMAERVGDEEVSLAYYGDGKLIPCKSLSLLGTPCEQVYKNEVYYCELEPCQTCSELARMGAKSYLGVALYDRQGNPMGLLCIFHRQHLTDPTHAEQILRVFAARAVTELERKRAENALQNLIAGTAALTGPDFFPALVRYLAEALRASHTFVTEVVEGDRLHFLAAWGDGEYLPNDTVDTEGTTCAIALQEGVYYCDRDVVAYFPQNPRLAFMGVESYMGIALQDRQGRKIGTLCLFSRQPLLDPERSEQIMRVFGARASAELERQRAQSALEQFNQELEQRVEAQTQEIVRSEKDLRTIFNNVYDGIFILDLDGSILDINNRVLELFKATRGQILATTIADLSAPSAPLHNLPKLLKQANAGAKLQFEWKSQRLDNSTFDSEVCLRKVTLGNRSAIVAGVRDISDRKQAENALQLSEARARATFSQASIGIAESNMYTGQLIQINDYFCKMLGYSPEELLAMSVADITHPEDMSESQHLIRGLANGKIKNFVTEKRYVRKDGSILFSLTSVTLVHMPDGKSNTCLAMLQDIGDRKQTEVKLQQTNQELARATRLKDEFLANMSHELRTPLNAILGMTEGLQEGVFEPMNAMQLKALKTIERSGFHLLELINDILDLAKIESGQVDLEYSSVAIEYLCQSSLVFVKQQSQKKGLQLHLKVPPNLPDITVDERRMRQVLINLLNNAVKFTPKGGQIVLEVAPLLLDKTSENYLRFTVTDTGIGISPDNLPKLFQPFIQIDSSLNRQYEGTGLGLALVKQIVELHKGWITVTSEVGVGSCFAIKLPYAISEPSFSPLLKANSELNGSAPVQPVQSAISPLILLAEDNEANIITVSNYLRAKGYRLKVAKNGQAAIDMAQKESPDLILMDIQMPHVDGLTAIEHIRQDPDMVQVPIIALTALTMEGDRERCLAAGADLYYSKPIRLKELVLSIQKLL